MTKIFHMFTHTPRPYSLCAIGSVYLVSVAWPVDCCFPLFLHCNGLAFQTMCIDEARFSVFLCVYCHGNTIANSSINTASDNRNWTVGTINTFIY